MRNFNAYALLLTLGLLTADVMQPGYLSFRFPAQDSIASHLTRVHNRYVDWVERQNQEFLQRQQKSQQEVGVDGLDSNRSI